MSECRGPGCTHPGCNGDRSDTSTAEDLRSRIDEALDPDATGGPVGVVDVMVGNPDAAETARYVMSGRMAP